MCQNRPDIPYEAGPPRQGAEDISAEIIGQKTHSADEGTRHSHPDENPSRIQPPHPGRDGKEKGSRPRDEHPPDDGEPDPPAVSQHPHGDLHKGV